MTGYSEQDLERMLFDLESDLAERKESFKAFDVQPVRTATLDDLDLRFFEKSYLLAAFARDVLDANEQSLAVTKMLVAADTPTPTVLGTLVLGNRPRDFFPGAYIQFLRVAGNALGDPIVDELLIDGPVQDILRRIDDKLVSHNRTAVDFTSGPIEKRTQTYPLAALQQFVRNAVLHRTYEATNAPVRVYWYDDRIEILSPGGPFGAVSAENFGAPGLTDYRNPNLAEALRVLGFVQHYGAGIPTAERELRMNGNPPPEFHVDASNVRVTVSMVK